MILKVACSHPVTIDSKSKSFPVLQIYATESRSKISKLAINSRI